MTTNVDSPESLSNVCSTTQGCIASKLLSRYKAYVSVFNPERISWWGLSIDRENKLTKSYFPVESSFGCPTFHPFSLDSRLQPCCVKLILGVHGGVLGDIEVYKNKPLFGCASVYLKETIAAFIKSLNTLELWCVDQRPLNIIRPAVVSATCMSASLDHASTFLVLGGRIVLSA